MLDDLDYGWRGWLSDIPSYYEPQCVIYHVGSPILQWNSKKFFFMERNRLICLFSLYSKKTLIKIFPLLILYDIGVSFFLISKGMGFVKFKSTFSFLEMFPSVLKRRKLIQSKRKLEDREIIENFVDYIDIPSDMNSDSSIFISIVVKLNKIARNLI
jgi:GT2 family glycosyltransferase